MAVAFNPVGKLQAMDILTFTGNFQLRQSCCMTAKPGIPVLRAVLWFALQNLTFFPLTPSPNFLPALFLVSKWHLKTNWFELLFWAAKLSSPLESVWIRRGGKAGAGPPWVEVALGSKWCCFLFWVTALSLAKVFCGPPGIRFFGNCHFGPVVKPLWK